MKKTIKSFKVLNWDFNSDKGLEYVDIIPFFVSQYKKLSKAKRPKTFTEFRTFIKKEGIYRFWSRVEYEIIVVQWPFDNKDPVKNAKKIDIWDQIEMNLDVITNLLMESV